MKEKKQNWFLSKWMETYLTVTPECLYICQILIILPIKWICFKFVEDDLRERGYAIREQNILRLDLFYRNASRYLQMGLCYMSCIL